MYSFFSVAGVPFLLQPLADGFASQPSVVKHPSSVRLLPRPAGAPYLLQPLADGFASEPSIVKLSLLTAAAKLFFSRPAESRKLLGACLAAGLNDSDQDVHDRALLYHRYAWSPAPAVAAVSRMSSSSAGDSPQNLGVYTSATAPCFGQAPTSLWCCESVDRSCAGELCWHLASSTSNA